MEVLCFKGQVRGIHMDSFHGRSQKELSLSVMKNGKASKPWKFPIVVVCHRQRRRFLGSHSLQFSKFKVRSLKPMLATGKWDSWIAGEMRIKSSRTAPRSTSHASLFSAKQKEESVSYGCINEIENCGQSKASLFLLFSLDFCCPLWEQRR